MNILKLLEDKDVKPMEIELFSDKDKKYRLKFVILSIVLLIIFVKMYLKYGWGMSCLLYQTTGIWCPLCGGTRSFVCLIHGNIGRAFAYNQLFIGTLPLTIYYTAIKTRDFINSGKVIIKNNVIKYSCIVMLSYMIIKNLFLLN